MAFRSSVGNKTPEDEGKTPGQSFKLQKNSQISMNTSKLKLKNQDNHETISTQNKKFQVFLPVQFCENIQTRQSLSAGE